MAVLFFLFVVSSGIGIGRVLASALDVKDELTAAEEAVKILDFESASTHLLAAQTAVGKAQSGFIFLAPLRLIPRLGSRVASMQELFSRAHERLLPTLLEVVGVGKDLVATSAAAGSQLTNFSDLSDTTRRQLLTRLSERLADLEQTSSALSLLQIDLDEIMALPLPSSIQTALKPFRAQLPTLKSQVDFLKALATILPEFGGLGVEKHFLLLFENNDELRPAGGFIGTIGDMTIQDGNVMSVATQDVYALDGPVEKTMTTQPPAPLTQYLKVPAWFLRDSNWSPDGPTSFAKALELLATEQTLQGKAPTSYDGVIAFTPTFISGLLKLLGPITVDDQTFNADNFAESLDYQVEYGYVQKGLHPIQRKEIVGKLTQQMVARLMQFPLSEWGEIIPVVDDAVLGKQLFVYSANDAMQKRIEAIGWSGQRIAPSTDALMVVDANLGSLKTDPSVARHITYRLRQNETGDLVASVSILYDHTGDFDWKTTRYRTYTRVYVPKGSTLLRSSGTLLDDRLNNPSLAVGPVDTTQEGEWTVFGAFTSVEPHEQQTLEFVYMLPPELAGSLLGGGYELSVLKQLGAQNSALTVDVDFGKPLLSATPPEESDQFGDSRYLLNTKLSHDINIYVRSGRSNDDDK